ncbi:uncharacterized protein V6R79_005291 [Siganus canaliculatus]
MAEMDPSLVSLMSLEDELTCSICLNTFDCPVTIPCGHNFCQDCLLATWKDSYCCPQCRTVFDSKPELKKNTVLSTVVETFRLRRSKSEASLITEESNKEKEDVTAIRCDTCMEAEASQTCLTCMASFCEEHLRPHRENPIFRLHKLTEPVSDMMKRICPDHHKLMEFFCSQHERSICSICLQEVHKGCSFTSPEEQRNLKESDFRGKLDLLNGKIKKNEKVISQMTELQNNLKDSATKRKKVLSADYQQMKDMLDREERDAVNAVDRELEGGQTKLRALVKKFTENITNMRKAKEDILRLLSQSQSLAFLEASFDLPAATTFDPYTPRITLDSKKVATSQAFTAVLKEHLTELFKQAMEDRLFTLKPELKVGSVASEGKTASASGATAHQPESALKRNPRSHSPGRALIRPPIQPMPVPVFVGPYGEYWNPAQYAQDLQNASGHPRLPRSHSPGPPPKATARKKTQKPNKNAAQSTEDTKDKKRNNIEASSIENLLNLAEDDKPGKHSAAAEGKPDITTAQKRNDLLKFATILTLDPKTAHKRVALSDDFTQASVSDEQMNYADGPERFSVCSQVLTTKGFSRGRHYWEVRLSSNNFIGVGLAYSSIDRKGPTSRLGRNAQSWCVEWFNNKLSAWHNSSETVLVSASPKRVGVLLDCEEGTATFFTVADRAYPIHCFVFPFAEAVYPAFWIFSSGSSVSLCKMQA